MAPTLRSFRRSSSSSGKSMSLKGISDKTKPVAKRKPVARCSIHDPPKRRNFIWDSRLKAPENPPIAIKKKTIRKKSTPISNSKKSTSASKKSIQQPPKSKNKTVIERRVATPEQKEATLQEAKELAKNLTPSVVKSMTPSAVYKSFWMNLGKDFCETHLPKKRMEIFIEDACGKRHPVVLIRNGLSGGWGGFAKDNKLHDGDAVVFQVIQQSNPTILKGHIVRLVNPNCNSPAEEPEQVMSSLEEPEQSHEQQC